MAISVASSETSRTPEQEMTMARMSRTRGGSGSLGEEDELQKLFEQLMGGEEEVEGLEDFDWEKLWGSLMGEEEAAPGNQQYEQGPSSRYPGMFGTHPLHTFNY